VFWTPFSVTNHSADLNRILRPGLNQYLSGKESFLLLPTTTNRIYIVPTVKKNSEFEE